MKLTILIFVFLVTGSVISAQNLTRNEKDSIDINNHNAKRNTVYFEILGNSVFGSLNYDYLFKSSNQKGAKVSMGCGIAIAPLGGIFGNWFTIAPNLNLIFGNKNAFETGIGYTYMQGTGGGLSNTTMTNDWYSIPIHIGFRHQDDKGLFYKFGFFLHCGGNGSWFWDHGFNFLNIQTGTSVSPWLGLSIGYSF